MDKNKTGLSDYEKERLKRIEENQKMLDELFPNGTRLLVNGIGGDHKESTPEIGGKGGGGGDCSYTPGGERSRITRTRYIGGGGGGKGG